MPNDHARFMAIAARKPMLGAAAGESRSRGRWSSATAKSSKCRTPER